MIRFTAAEIVDRHGVPRAVHFRDEIVSEPTASAGNRLRLRTADALACFVSIQTAGARIQVFE